VGSKERERNHLVDHINEIVNTQNTLATTKNSLTPSRQPKTTTLCKHLHSNALATAQNILASWRQASLTYSSKSVKTEFNMQITLNKKIDIQILS